MTVKVTNFNVLHIIKPFYSAGGLYGWDRKIPGIGIAEKVIMKALKEHTPIYIRIGKDKQIYQVSPETVVRFAKKHGSIRPVRNGVKVAVISQDHLKKVKDEEVYTEVELIA